MATKRRPLHSNLNFRPNTSDSNIDFRGTKPTSEPTSVREALTLMVLFLCKKTLFFDTNLKVAIYLGTLFLLSLITDFASFPKTYLSRSDNIFNKYFVKFAWGWNLILLAPFVGLTTYIYCCAQKQRILKYHLPRIAVATFFWWFWTTLFNVVEAAVGRCAQKGFETKESCLQAGLLWNGFDISGHTFILIYGSLFLIEETRCIENWDSIKEHLRLENHHRVSKDSSQNLNPLRHLSNDQIQELEFNYKKYTPYIRGLFIVITVFQLMWDVMLVCTILYYHIMIEKFLGGILAILTWFFTYRVWFSHPKFLPKLPGEGVFRYIKKKTSKEQPSAAARRRTASIFNGPTFMGRPLYPNQEAEAAS